MPAIGNIAISDGKSTPVTHTFAPKTTDGSTGKLANRAPAIAAGFELLDLTIREPGSAAASYALQGQMVLPVVEVVNGVNTVTRQGKSSITLNFSQASTAQERIDQLKLLQNLLGHATVIAMVTNLEPLY